MKEILEKYSDEDHPITIVQIIEILKNAAESNNQKNVLTSQMFKDTDMLAASPRGIPSSARVWRY